MLTATDGLRDDRFGYDVAIDGDTAVVGANGVDPGFPGFDRGAAYVFVRQGSVWTLQQKLSASDAANFDGFGIRVAISGDTIVVSSYLDDIAANENQGSVYVFSRTGSVWNEVQKLVAADGSAADFFGFSISISRTEDSILIGSYNDDIGINQNQGSAYVFSKIGGSWTQEAKLLADDGTEFSEYGTSVTIDSGYAIVGNSKYRGAVYVYVKTPSSTWTQQQKLLPAPSEQFGNEHFGSSVGLDGSTMVVGAPDETVGMETQQGVAYVFERNGETWSQSAKLSASDGFRYDSFGKRVAVEGDQIVVGSPLDDTDSISSHGSAYVFSRAGSTWTQVSKIGAANAGFNDYFGENVDISDGVVIAGCSGRQIGSNVGQGSAFIFADSRNAPDLQAVSDTGISTEDNVTQSRNLVFDISDVTIGASVELLRNGVPIASLLANTSSIVLADNDAPAAGNIRYVVRQTLPNQMVVVGAPAVVMVDIENPTVTINQSVGQVDPTRILPVAFAVTFSEPVVGFDVTDISLIGSTANVANAISFLSGAGTDLVASVYNFTANGQTVNASINASGMQDLAGNMNAPSSSFDNIIAVDNVAPTVTINQSPDQSDPTTGQPVRFIVVFSEPVTGFDGADVSLVGSTANVAGAIITVTGSSGSNYNVAVGGITASGLLRVRIPANGAAQDIIGNASLPSSSTDRTVTVILRPASFDYDGDGRADLTVRRPSNDLWYLQRTTAGYTAMQWGVAGDLMAPADYDGDSKTDIAIFRPSSGQWFIFNSGNQSFQVVNWGADGDLPVPADHDGDGKADLVVFRPATNTWYVRSIANGPFLTTEFGAAGDKPVRGDFDGDGKGDIGIFRPSTSTWYIRKTTAGFFVQTWGETGDIPVPADYDGDGVTDVAVWRPSTGQWFRINSAVGFDTVNWGVNGDKPIPVDYDGDGKADVAIFRPSSGTWYIVGTTAGISQTAFGQDGDLPTPGAFIY